MGLGSRREVPSDYRDRVRWRQPIPSLPLRPRSGGRSRGLLEGAAATALACLAACGGGAEVQGPPNVLLFAVDTLRADRVGALSGVDLTPRIDAFAPERSIPGLVATSFTVRVRDWPARSCPKDTTPGDTSRSPSTR